MPKNRYAIDSVNEKLKKMKNIYFDVPIPKTPPPSFEVLDDVLIITEKTTKKYRKLHCKWLTSLSNDELSLVRKSTILTGSINSLIERILYLRWEKLKVADFIYKNRTAKPLDYLMNFGQYKGKFITELPPDYLNWLVKESFIKGGFLNSVLEIIKGNKDFYRPQVISI